MQACERNDGDGLNPSGSLDEGALLCLNVRQDVAAKEHRAQWTFPG